MKTDININLVKLFDKLMAIFSYSLLGFVLSYLLFSLLDYSLSSIPSDKAFGMIPGLRMPTFADLRWITATGGCSVNINDIYSGKSVGCDSFGRQGIGYPPMSLWVSRILGIKGDHTPLISLAISFSFISVILSQMRSSLRAGWLLIMVGSIFLIGFPVQLGLERLNIDLLIFLLLYLSALLFSSHILVLLLFMMIFVISLKYYPVFAFIALMLKGLPQKVGTNYFVPPWLILFIGSCIGLGLSLPWATNGEIASTLASGGLNSHGLTSLGFLNKPLVDSFGLSTTRWILKAIVGLKILMLLSGAYMAYRFNLTDILVKTVNIHTAEFKNKSFPADFYHSLIVSMTSVWLGCYIVTISFDYRMIFLFPVLIFIARAIQLSVSSLSGQISSTQRRGLLCLLVAMLASMLIPFIGHAYLDPLTRVAIDAIAEFILIPFYASSLAVIVIGQIIMARRASGLFVRPG